MGASCVHCNGTDPQDPEPLALPVASNLKQREALPPTTTRLPPPDVIIYPGENINDANGGPNMLVPPRATTTAAPTRTSLPTSLPTSFSTSVESPSETSTGSVSASTSSPSSTASPTSSLVSSVTSRLPQPSSTSLPTVSGSQSSENSSTKNHNGTTTTVVVLVSLLILALVLGYVAFRFRQRRKRNKQAVPSKFAEFKTAKEISNPILNTTSSDLETSPKAFTKPRIAVGLPANPRPSRPTRKSDLYSSRKTNQSGGRDSEFELDSLEADALSYYFNVKHETDDFDKKPDHNKDGFGTYSSSSSTKSRRLQGIPFKIPSPSKPAAASYR